jgi:hypothetical protein
MQLYFRSFVAQVFGNGFVIKGQTFDKQILFFSSQDAANCKWASSEEEAKKFCAEEIAKKLLFLNDQISLKHFSTSEN